MQVRGDGEPDTAKPKRGRPRTLKARVLRWLGFAALVGLVVTVLLSFHQPLVPVSYCL